MLAPPCLPTSAPSHLPPPSPPAPPPPPPPPMPLIITGHGGVHSQQGAEVRHLRRCRQGGQACDAMRCDAMRCERSAGRPTSSLGRSVQRCVPSTDPAACPRRRLLRALARGPPFPAGTLTCAKYPGSLGYERQDAQMWAEWGELAGVRYAGRGAQDGVCKLGVHGGSGAAGGHLSPGVPLHGAACYVGAWLRRLLGTRLSEVALAAGGRALAFNPARLPRPTPTGVSICIHLHFFQRWTI